jgi:pilus assembly protein Flp/PilA
MTSFATFCSNATRQFGQLLVDERGATAIEYAMIASGVSIVIAATVFSLGSSVKTALYDKIAAALQ